MIKIKVDKMEYFDKTDTSNWSLLGYLRWRLNFSDFSNKLHEHRVFFDLVKDICDEGGERGERANSIWRDFK
ncbi:13190_t:CDS:2, partial [Acaulospora morrowiae]